MADPFLHPVHEIRIKPVLPCGLNILALCAIACTLRNTHEPVEPVLVRWLDTTGEWLLLDGRHRWVAHILAGREMIRCVEEQGERQ